LFNNPFFHQFFDGSDAASQQAFGELVKDRAIVPFQGAEASLVPTSFDVHAAGHRALASLLEKVGDDLSVVRLARSDEGNRTGAQLLADRFVSTLTGYVAVRRDKAATMLRELTRRADVSEDEIEAFRRSLRELASFAAGRAAELADENRDFNRNEVYGKFFATTGANVADGDFEFKSIPFVRELKKLVDLRYNVGLPDALNRFAFAPYGFPSRSALQDVLPPDESTDLRSYLDSLDNFARSDILQGQHQDMLLPDFDELTLDDVVRIRALPQWRDFAGAQSRLLADPSKALLALPEFREKLLAFQEALHRLYETNRREITRRKCVSAVGIALKFAGILVPIGHQSGWSTVLAQLSDVFWEKLLPSTIKGMSVELLVNVVDVNGNYRNMSHSYQMESIRSQSEYRTDEIKQIVSQLQSAKEITAGNVDPAGEQSRA
jgi:hypothetical protein